MTNSKKVEYLEIDEGIYEDNEVLMRSKASRTFIGWNGDTSIKSHYTQPDYDYFRQIGSDKSRASILKTCQTAYDKVGIIKNVIDLMSDFGSKGIRIRHPDPEIDNFCKKWFYKVDGLDRSERFLNTLYRLGSVIIYSKMGRAVGEDIQSNYIPIKYLFLNPAAVEVKDEARGIIPANFEYILRYSHATNLRIIEKDHVQAVIPEELKKYKDGVRPLPNTRLSVYNYRKDDWQFWGWPITYPLLDDLRLLEKLKLSDLSALDGAISTVRLWTVGKITDNPQTTILPTKPMLQKVRNMISQGINGGSMDLVFGPEVDFKESSTSVHQFLGEAKYKPTIDSIYDGLGIPSPLRSSSKDNTNSNAISLKTLIERLNYGRMYLVDFWVKQLKTMFETLGFETDEDPIVEFDYMILTDEAAEKKLLLDMADRDLVDMELVHERFKIPTKITKAKLKEEVQQRGNDLPVKSSPYHNPHVEDEMKKMLLQAGDVIPAEIGLDIDVSKTEQTRRYKEKKKMEKLGNQKFTDTPGRPRNITETSKRQPKTKQSSSRALVWASQAQKDISEIYTPIVLKIYKKKNVRSLSTKETIALEDAKAKILMGIEPFEEINEKSIEKAIAKKADISMLKAFISEFDDMQLNIDQKRQLISIFYEANIQDGKSSS